MRAANTKKRRNPNYAIVKIPESANVIEFYQLLLENGYNEVSFVNAVSESAFLPYSTAEPTTKTNGDCLKLAKNRPNDMLNRRQSLANGMLPGGDAAFNDNAIAQLPSVLPSVTFNDIAGDCSKSLLAQLMMNSTTFDSATVGCDNSQATANVSASRNGTSRKSTARLSATATDALAAASSNNGRHLIITSASSSDHRSSSTIKEEQPSTPTVVVSVKETHRPNATLFAMNEPLRVESAGEEQPVEPMVAAGDGVDEDGGTYATCLLCQNRIMSSRLSNLTNHVRRHASMKQYQCTHCSYSHNEQAKVRLHLSNNHEDFTSQPVDRLCFEMQLQWNQLMEQCFPVHSKRSKDSEYWKLASAGAPPPPDPAVVRSSTSAAGDGLSDAGDTPASPPQSWQHACTACGELLTRQQALAHIRDRHHTTCVMFTCTACGYRGIEHRYARVHCSVKHPNGDTRIEPLPPGNHEMFMKRYFPSLMFTPENESSLDKGETFACKLCGNAFSASGSALLVHAKNHCREKQFRCTECDYASIDRRSARSHMQSCHNTDREPFDSLNAKLKKLWIAMVRKCFPHVSSDGDDDYTFLDVDLRKGRRRQDGKNVTSADRGNADGDSGGGDCSETTSLTPRETRRLLCASRRSEEKSPRESISPTNFGSVDTSVSTKNELKREADDAVYGHSPDYSHLREKAAKYDPWNALLELEDDDDARD